MRAAAIRHFTGRNQKRLHASILAFTQDMLFVDMTIASYQQQS
jgi:hypothetical protein